MVDQLPEFNTSGDLSPGIFRVSLETVEERFGSSTLRRIVLMTRLRHIYTLAQSTNHLQRFIVFGSFVTTKRSPNDVDVFLLMDDEFEVDKVKGEASLVFEHSSAQASLGASVFWIRRIAALGDEEALLSYWQTTRDGTLRGILEIV